jgi:hypothetical protein
MKRLPLANKEWDRITELFNKELLCVVEIYEVMSEKELKGPKKELFHGTKANNIENILRMGLKMEYNVTSAYGKGTYFSDLVSISLEGYTDANMYGYVFLCDVLEEHLKYVKGTNFYVCSKDEDIKIKYLIKFYKETPRVDEKMLSKFRNKMY